MLTELTRQNKNTVQKELKNHIHGLFLYCPGSSTAVLHEFQVMSNQPQFNLVYNMLPQLRGMNCFYFFNESKCLWCHNFCFLWRIKQHLLFARSENKAVRQNKICIFHDCWENGRFYPLESSILIVAVSDLQ